MSSAQRSRNDDAATRSLCLTLTESVLGPAPPVLHHVCRRLVSTLQPFPGMQHLDMAGGTGDVAFRVLRAMRAAEAQAAARPTSRPRPPPAGAAAAGPSSSQQQQQQQEAAQHPERGRVVVCDINPQMLEEGRRKAQAAPDLAGAPLSPS